MKHNLFLSMFLAFTIFSLGATADILCAKVLSQNIKLNPELLWRVTPNLRQTKDYMAMSYSNQSGEFSKTSEKRERTIKDYSLYIKHDIYINDNEAAGMSIFPEVGTKLTLEEPWGDCGSGKLPLFKASKVSAGGVLKASLALPVSGRFGQKTTKEWSKNDDITIYMLDKNNKKTVLINQVRSLDIVTVQELEIPLIAGEEIRIFYDRSGSAGPMGFPEGRIIRILWDGTLK